MLHLKIVLFITFFAPLSLIGQSLIGLNLGSNQATFHTDPANELITAHTSPAYQGSFFYKGRKNKHLNLMMELNYRIKSNDLWILNSGLNNAADIYGHFNLSYLSYSILPEVRFGRRFEWYLHVGPYLSYLLYSSFTGHEIGYGMSYPGIVAFNGFNTDANKVIGSSEWGGLAGSGFNYKLSAKLNVNAEIRYFFCSPSMNFRSNDLGIVAGISYLLETFNPLGKLSKVLSLP